MTSVKQIVHHLEIAHRDERVLGIKTKTRAKQSPPILRTALRVYAPEGYQYIKYEQILYCRSMGNYTEVFFEENGAMKSLVVSKTLKTIQAALPPAQFLRCHQSYLIARDQIKLLTKNQTLILLMGTEIPVSRRMRKALLATL